MKTEVIKFFNQDITFITENTFPHVCIKHLCEGIGLNENSALRELKNNDLFAEYRTEQYATGTDGKQYLMVFLPFQYTIAWLFNIKITNTMSKETKGNLKLYRREFPKLLGNFFLYTKYINQNIARKFEVSVKIKQVNRQIRDLMVEHKALEKEMKRLDTDNYAQLNLFDEDLMEQSQLNDSSFPGPLKKLEKESFNQNTLG